MAFTVVVRVPNLNAKQLKDVGSIVNMLIE
jgi:hypothetical protein